ncbi:MAG: acyl-CoA dehydrogenase domain-containing protein, partial [Pseudohongiellaceae bacterium]
SCAFAFVTDIALATLGGSLKRREYLSGRFADTLGWMYLGSATLKYYADEGNQSRDKALLHWSMTYILHQAEQALAALLRNMPRPLGGMLRLLVFPFGARMQAPDDRQTDALVESLLDPDSGVRDFLTGGVYVPAGQDPVLGKLEVAHARLQETAPARARVLDARRKGLIHKGIMEDMAQAANSKGIIDDTEYQSILDAQEAVNRAIAVNDFPPEEFSNLK